jgi:hypothetical protein
MEKGSPPNCFAVCISFSHPSFPIFFPWRLFFQMVQKCKIPMYFVVIHVKLEVLDILLKILLNKLCMFSLNSSNFSMKILVGLKKIVRILNDKFKRRKKNSLKHKNEFNNINKH